jgi:hypothetical protein
MIDGGTLRTVRSKLAKGSESPSVNLLKPVCLKVEAETTPNVDERAASTEERIFVEVRVESRRIANSAPWQLELLGASVSEGLPLW